MDLERLKAALVIKANCEPAACLHVREDDDGFPYCSVHEDSGVTGRLGASGAGCSQILVRDGSMAMTGSLGANGFVPAETIQISDGIIESMRNGTRVLEEASA